MSLTKTELTALCESAKTAAIAAGQYIQSQVEKRHKKHQKLTGDSLASQVVTSVDLKAQEIILSHLRESILEYDLGLLTEEAPDDQSRMQKSQFWCIDPLDGTLPFTEGRTGYAVSMALVSLTGDPLIGVVYVPDLEECYVAIKGHGVRLNDKSFARSEQQIESTIHVYMDRSLQTEKYYHLVTSKLNRWERPQKTTQVQYHVGFGAVRNALGVMHSETGCYFKFPKQEKGGGSIWDFAATRLFFEELNLFISNAEGHPLHLNNPQTTYMNDVGAIYSTEPNLSKYIIVVGSDIASR